MRVTALGGRWLALHAPRGFTPLFQFSGRLRFPLASRMVRRCCPVFSWRRDHMRSVRGREYRTGQRRALWMTSTESPLGWPRWIGIRRAPSARREPRLAPGADAGRDRRRSRAARRRPSWPAGNNPRVSDCFQLVSSDTGVEGVLAGSWTVVPLRSRGGSMTGHRPGVASPCALNRR